MSASQKKWAEYQTAVAPPGGRYIGFPHAALPSPMAFDFPEVDFDAIAGGISRALCGVADSYESLPKEVRDRVTKEQFQGLCDASKPAPRTEPSAPQKNTDAVVGFIDKYKVPLAIGAAAMAVIWVVK